MDNRTSSRGKIRRTAQDLLPGQPTTCSFCGRLSNASHSAFNFLSRDHRSLVCSRCVTRFSILQRLSQFQRDEFTDLDSHALGLRMQKGIWAEGGPDRMRWAAITIGMDLGQRVRDVFVARRGGKPPPGPWRYLVDGGDAGRFRALLERCVNVAGILMIRAEAAGVDDAERRLMAAFQGDALLAEVAGVLYFRDGTPPDAEAARFSSVSHGPHPEATRLDDPL